MAIDYATVINNTGTGGDILLNAPNAVAYLDSAGSRGVTGRSNIVNKYETKNIGIDFKQQSAMLLTTPNPNAGKDAIPSIFGTNQFLLTAFREVRQEKVQILETFGAPSLYFFDEKTKVYNITGVLLEAKPANLKQRFDYEDNSDFTQMRNQSKEWVGGFKEFWNTHLRGSKLAESGRIALLVFGNDIMYGYPVSFTLNKSSATPAHRIFNMSMIITDHVTKESYSYYYKPYLSEDVLMILQLGSIMELTRLDEISRITDYTIVNTTTIDNFINIIANQLITLKEDRDELLAEIRGLDMNTPTYGNDVLVKNSEIEDIDVKITELETFRAEVEVEIFKLSNDNNGLQIKLNEQST